MMRRINEAYDSKEKAERAMSLLPIGDRDCHVSMARLSKATAEIVYNKPEIWIVSGEIYS